MIKNSKNEIGRSFSEMIIDKNYSMPTNRDIDFLKNNSSMVKIDNKHSRVLVKNIYYNNGHVGTNPDVFIRMALWKKLLEGLNYIDVDYCFIIFDGFRSKTTQLSIYNEFYLNIKKNNPHFNDEQLHSETKKFAAHPQDDARFSVPPHNSGGAIDLSLGYKGKDLDMGTEFDDLTYLARTDFFEQDYVAGMGIDENRWKEVRAHRRMLFNLMKKLGFTNYEHEWWHYDQGDCLWSACLNIPWVYLSAET